MTHTKKLIVEFSIKNYNLKTIFSMSYCIFNFKII